MRQRVQRFKKDSLTILTSPVKPLACHSNSSKTPQNMKMVRDGVIHSYGCIVMVLWVVKTHFTVEPLNKGHFGTNNYILFCFCPLQRGCPLQNVLELQCPLLRNLCSYLGSEVLLYWCFRFTCFLSTLSISYCCCL